MPHRLSPLFALALACLAGAVPTAIAQDGVPEQAQALSQGEAPADAALFAPVDLVAARQGLMEQIAMMRADIEIALEAGDANAYDVLVRDFGAIAANLDAFPHLFAASSAPDALAQAEVAVDTDAAPAIWDDPSAFLAMAQDAATSARTAARSPDIATMADASARVWESCARCHAQYLDYDPFAAMEASPEDEIDSPFFQ